MILITFPQTSMDVWQTYIKQGPQAAPAMANQILNMPIAVTNCHNDLYTCWFQSTGQCRHVCSCLFEDLSVTFQQGGVKAMVD